VAETTQVVTYSVGEGVTVGIEIAPVDGFEPAGIDDVAGYVQAAVAPAITAARAVLEQVRAVAPDTVQVKFGVKVTGTANWLVAKAATEGNFEISMTWDRGGRPPADDGGSDDDGPSAE